MHLKRGQMFYLDMMVGVVIFLTAMIFYYQANVNFLDQDDDVIQDLDLEARLISDSLMGTGFPEQWNMTNVLELGITDKSRINETKLDYFAAMNYNDTRNLLRTKYEYYLFFESSSGPMDINSSHEGTGKPGANSTNIIDEYNPYHLIKIVRFVAYKSNPRRMVLYLWK